MIIQQKLLTKCRETYEKSVYQSTTLYLGWKLSLRDFSVGDKNRKHETEKTRKKRRHCPSGAIGGSSFTSFPARCKAFWAELSMEVLEGWFTVTKMHKTKNHIGTRFWSKRAAVPGLKTEFRGPAKFALVIHVLFLKGVIY